MNTDFYAFGEILWDCLPSGRRHPGGAPFNVAAHLAQLGRSVSLISSVGQDSLGDELLQAAREKRVATNLVTRARTGLRTGTVRVALDASGNATYEIVEPVAWDEIKVETQSVEAVGKGCALIYGSLAARSSCNGAQLDRLLALNGPVKFFDVNLRPPFVDPRLVLDLAQRADVIKLNEDELGRVASWLQTGERATHFPRTARTLQEACAALSRATGGSRICVTRAAEGAALWDAGNFICVPAPRVVVQDTVGAGDAFMAGLMVGLTRCDDPKIALERACQLGAYAASQHGATPLLPPDLIAKFAP